MSGMVLHGALRGGGDGTDRGDSGAPEMPNCKEVIACAVYWAVEATMAPALLVYQSCFLLFG